MRTSDNYHIIPQVCIFLLLPVDGMFSERGGGGGYMFTSLESSEQFHEA